ncbi:MAG: transglutaminase-like domain-containing protein [Candidatus Micrarchaeota archaeon]|nr:transglutaminase-like domain-containing protein [Candidatus Micrarchaeota archaeon]
MMRKLATSLVLFVLVVHVIAAQSGNFNPTIVSSITVELSRGGKITSTTGELSSLEVSLAIPQRTDYQQVSILLPPGAQVARENGNDIALLTHGQAFKSYAYSVSANVTSRSRGVYALPSKYTKAHIAQEYLSGTEHIIITPEITRQARAVTAGYKEDIDKVAALAIWVNNYVRYDPSDLGKNRDSAEVMKSPHGVCVEFTNLFVALARSLGYPARTVLGYVYSPEYGWQLHSWAEVYIGEWVGVDPTWLEAGYIDATHIPMYFSSDTSTELVERASAVSSSEDSEMVWEGRGALGSGTEDIKILNYTFSVPEYRIRHVPETLTAGDEGAIIIEVDSPSYQLFSARVAPCESDTEIVRFDHGPTTVLLHPGKNYVMLPFRVSTMLNKGYSYYCPVWVSHNFGSDKIQLVVGAIPKPAKKFSAMLSNYYPRKAEVKIASLHGENITIVSEFGKESVAISPRSARGATIDFSDGFSEVLLVHDSTHAQVIRLPYYAQPYSNSVYKIKDLSLTTSIPSDRVGRLLVAFDTVGNITYEVQVYADGKPVGIDKSSAPSYILNYTIFPEPGSHTISFVVDFGTEKYKYDASYEVFDPKISVDKASIDGRNYTFSVSGPYQAYAIYVDGKEVSGVEGIILTSGEHTLAVVWIDKAGIERVHEEKFYAGIGDAGICTAAGLVFTLSLILIYIKSKKQVG